MNGKSIVVATSTASGKSLCYNVPVLEELSKSPNACALYLFPTKVLSIRDHGEFVLIFCECQKQVTLVGLWSMCNDHVQEVNGIYWEESLL